MAEKMKVDRCVREVIETGVKLRHRCLLFVLGRKGRQQVMILHHLLTKASAQQHSVLWCHKKDSSIPRHSRKHLRKLEKNISSGKCDVSEENAFDLFLLSTPVKYCVLQDSHTLLGNTFGMCVIEDFQTVTPNYLCRVVETVVGGGVVVVLLPEVLSLRELSVVEMEVHSRLTTHSHPKVTPLFNERLVCSLGWCESCLVLSDGLEVLAETPSQRSKRASEVSKQLLRASQASNERLTEIQTSLQDAEKPLPQLVNCCRTFDQAQALLKMIDVITERNAFGTVAVTAARGRGKSAALGLATAAAIHLGLSNIFVSSPTPENLGTFFQFVFKGFDALEYEEQTDYEVIQSTNAEFGGAVVRVCVFRDHRQTVQYITPADADTLRHAELVVVDEAAAIPLHQVKSLIGSCTAIMASTVNGYEGTGRSLSLKLLQQLRTQAGQGGAAAQVTATQAPAPTRRSLHEVTLRESIRYAQDDPVEGWLHCLLCLDATNTLPPATTCPPPHTCHLYYVNRQVLFKGHSESEAFLQQVMALLVASHYRNSPDDLQVLCDAPAHHLFVLLPPLPPRGSASALPTALAVVQVCLEGRIPAEVTRVTKSRGERPSGDLVPWVLSSQFLRPDLTDFSGVRVVRVATHPDYQSMGYGSRAIKLLGEYYAGRHISLDEEGGGASVPCPASHTHTAERETNAPLLSTLAERQAETVDYIGVSYGITLPLLKFWARAGYVPLYISQVPNKVTGEHSCVMVNTLRLDTGGSDDYPAWLKDASEEFLRRFLSLLGGPLGSLHPLLSLAVIQAHVTAGTVPSRAIAWEELRKLVTGQDLLRLEKYSKNLADRHLITDILPHLARLLFSRRFPSLHLSPIQSALIVGLGLQLKNFHEIAQLLDLPLESVLGQFNRAVRKVLKIVTSLQERSITRHLPKTTKLLSEFVPVSISLSQDLDEAAEDYREKEAAREKLQPQTRELLGDIAKFAIKSDEAAWDTALQSGSNSVISVKSHKRPAALTEEELQKELQEPKTTKEKKNTKKRKKSRL